LAEFVEAANITGIDANFVDRVIHSLKGHAMVEVDIADQWYIYLLFNFGEGCGIFRFGHGDPDQFAAGFFKAAYLLDHLSDMESVGRGHGLDTDGVIPTNADPSDLNHACFVAFETAVCLASWRGSIHENHALSCPFGGH
jgi:hypothetical protein